MSYFPESRLYPKPIPRRYLGLPEETPASPRQPTRSTRSPSRDPYAVWRNKSPPPGFPDVRKYPKPMPEWMFESQSKRPMSPSRRSTKLRSQAVLDELPFVEWTEEELKRDLRSKGLSTEGTKEELMDRIILN